MGGAMGEPMLRYKKHLNQSSDAEKSGGEANGLPIGSAKLAILATMLVAAGVLFTTVALVLVFPLFEQGIRVARGIDVGALYSQHFIYALLIALANNVDNLGARIAYSIQGTKISTPINLWISVITFIISSWAAFSGTTIAGSMGTKVASTIAMGLLVALGAWMILQARNQNWLGDKPPSENSTSLWTILLKPEHADKDNSKHIDFKEGTVLGIALSINNIGGGLSAGMIGLSPLLVGVLSAVVSFVALWIGNYVADIFINLRIADKAAVIGGILLIAIGVKQVV
jgi:putative sporulation protein YtaF